MVIAKFTQENTQIYESGRPMNTFQQPENGGLRRGASRAPARPETDLGAAALRSV